MAEQVFAGAESVDSSVVSTTSSGDDNPLFMDAYEKCMGGQPGSKCGAPPTPESTTPSENTAPSTAENTAVSTESSAPPEKQLGLPTWFTRPDKDNNEQLSQDELRNALTYLALDFREKTMIRYLNEKFDEASQGDDFITIPDLEEFFGRNSKQGTKRQVPKPN